MDAPNQNSAEPIPAQDSTNRNSNIRENETQPSSGVGAEPQLPPTEAKGSNPTKRIRKIANLRKAGVFWLEIGTFIVLVAYAKITENQWHTALQATSATQVAANAAQSQLVKMDESNRINREALQSVQRAFITFPPSPKVSYFPTKGWFTLEMPIENAGATQAHGLKDRVSWVATMGKLPDKYSFPDRGGEVWHNSGSDRRECHSFERQDI
jgi:hypothetical protein